MKIQAWLFFLAVFCLFNCESKNPSTASPPPESSTSGQSENAGDDSDLVQKRIVCFGNSLTAGYGLEESQAYPALLQKRIDSLGLAYEVVNAGLSGETSSGGVNRIDWILGQPVDIFILELGANDALRGLDLNRTRQNLQGIVDKVLATYPDAVIIIAGMKAPPNMGIAYTDNFADVFTDLARENDLELIPFLLEGVAANSSLNLEDGIHPNVQGQRLVMENIWSVLEKHVVADS